MKKWTSLLASAALIAVIPTLGHADGHLFRLRVTLTYHPTSGGGFGLITNKASPGYQKLDTLNGSDQTQQIEEKLNSDSTSPCLRAAIESVRNGLDSFAQDGKFIAAAQAANTACGSPAVVNDLLEAHVALGATNGDDEVRFFFGTSNDGGQLSGNSLISMPKPISGANILNAPFITYLTKGEGNSCGNLQNVLNTIDFGRIKNVVIAQINNEAHACGQVSASGVTANVRSPITLDDTSSAGIAN